MGHSAARESLITSLFVAKIVFVAVRASATNGEDETNRKTCRYVLVPRGLRSAGRQKAAKSAWQTSRFERRVRGIFPAGR